MKRLKNEISRMLSNKPDDIEILEYNKFNLYIDLKIQKINLILGFNIKDTSYPFRPPKVEVNFINYLSYLKYNNFYERYKIDKSNKCLCCSTIICRNNWGPAFTILKIVEEIKKNFTNKIRIIERFYFDKVLNSLGMYDTKFYELL